MRGNQHDDEALRRGGRESVERGDFDDGRVERFDLQIRVLRDAANAVTVRLSELNLGVAERWRGAFVNGNAGVWRARGQRTGGGRGCGGLRNFAAEDSIERDRWRGADGGFLRRRPGEDHALMSDFGFEVRDRIGGGRDAQGGGVGISRRPSLVMCACARRKRPACWDAG